MQMTDVVNRRKMRHAHMVNIDQRIMLEGMRADFDEVDRISTQVWKMASRRAEIRATTPAGTDIVPTFSPQLKWLKTSGIISPHKWGNLPGGETFTTPWKVNGTFVDRWRGGRLSLREIRRPARRLRSPSRSRATA